MSLQAGIEINEWVTSLASLEPSEGPVYQVESREGVASLEPTEGPEKANKGCIALRSHSVIPYRVVALFD